MNRLFLYSGFLFVLILIFDAYDRDYNQPQDSPSNIVENNTTSDSKQPPQTDSIKPDSPDKSSPISKNIDVLESNKLIIEFDINTGELLRNMYAFMPLCSLKVNFQSWMNLHKFYELLVPSTLTSSSTSHIFCEEICVFMIQH